MQKKKKNQKEEHLGRGTKINPVLPERSKENRRQSGWGAGLAGAWESG